MTIKVVECHQIPVKQQKCIVKKMYKNYFFHIFTFIFT